MHLAHMVDITMANRAALRRQHSRDGDRPSGERRELRLVRGGFAMDVDNRSDIARQQTFARQSAGQHIAVVFFEHDSSEYLDRALEVTVNVAAPEQYRHTVPSER